MILWDGNFNIEYATIESMCSKLKTIPKAYVLSHNHYSSYQLDTEEKPDFILNDFYKQVIEHVCKKLTTYERSRYRWSYWLQVYEPGSLGHGVHDHWSGSEMFSWVHFLKPVNKSFHFLVEGQKVYIEKQNAGDFIVFPSWALHAVDGNDTNDERVVIAGNVLMDSLNVDYGDGHVKYSTCTRINKETHWSVIDQ